MPNDQPLKTKEKKTRKKRRLPNSSTPPRVSLTLRMEQSTFNAMDELLKTYKGSRNDYICRLIELDLLHVERFKPLNTPVEVTPEDILSLTQKKEKGKS
jgi:hypothetical protein